jgi:hypothetical protein
MGASLRVVITSDLLSCPIDETLSGSIDEAEADERAEHMPFTAY